MHILARLSFHFDQFHCMSLQHFADVWTPVGPMRRNVIQVIENPFQLFGSINQSCKKLGDNAVPVYYPITITACLHNSTKLHQYAYNHSIYLGPILSIWLNLAPARISNHTLSKVSDDITYPFATFNSCIC